MIHEQASGPVELDADAMRGPGLDAGRKPAKLALESIGANFFNSSKFRIFSSFLLGGGEVPDA